MGMSREALRGGEQMRNPFGSRGTCARGADAISTLVELSPHHLWGGPIVICEPGVGIGSSPQSCG